MSKVQTGYKTDCKHIDPTSDEALLHLIEPSLVNLKEELTNTTSKVGQAQ